jgi:hypothetical protein
MRNSHNSKPYHINITYGEADLIQIIDDLAKQTIQKNTGDFVINNDRVKKSESLRRAI